MKNKKNVIGFTIILVLFLFCSVWLTKSSCPDSYTEFLDNKHNILIEVSPPPDSKISFGCYTKRNLINFTQRVYVSDPHNKGGWVENGGVNIKIISNTELVNLERDHTNNEHLIFEKRVLLYIDEKLTPINLIWKEQTEVLEQVGSNANLAGSYIFVSNIFLFPGSHDIKIEVQTVSGEILSFNWQITINY